MQDEVDTTVIIEEPASFKIFTPEDKGMIGDYLKTPDGMTMAQYGSEDEYVYIQKVSLKLPLIEKFNESDYACKIIGVLETDPEDD